jgi:hypothetical protein
VADSAYVLSVSRIVNLQGTRSNWSGEEVSFRPEFVKDVSARRLSKVRSYALAASATALAAWFIGSRDLLGLRRGGRANPVGNGGQEG